MAEFHAIRYEAGDGLAEITLSRPEKRNAIDVATFGELGDAAQLAADDPDVRAVIVRGEGPAFCAGLDVSAVGELAGLRGPRFRSFVRRAQRPYLLLQRMAKPTIAAVRGHAVGAGFQLALACDLRVATAGSTFAMLEARFGLIPDLGGMHALTRLVGPALTKELVWSARAVDADESLRIGLVNRVVDDEQLEAESRRLAREVTTHSPTAAALVKSLVNRSPETGLEDELDREADAQALCLDSPDHRESVAAHLERRAPRFGG